ncbi:MAG: Glycoside hydrolase 15-related protein [Candidatus Kaiserbacteria bacterium GW2011_GWC2_52_8b]|uniref:Glycoside hydrolase 15-related protein n=2 Tax=Candidatus Kaiseribacteriota TaxID=1752734 RepID=A0A0G1XJ60_9BACT|nr:MAG: Glycoside hydrolase 15-related protein [Candidatus Kaiserbacteria bacterium GW2011_GWA2_52_12]KKW30996.1 MAG: Glycoside hydrolase 15-related protein [Candidatus Kaiserbacteria bacterium GW2011_GWC2_52_8b]
MAAHPIYERLIAQHLKILESLQYESGLFAASKKGIGTGYDKAWLRDNFYECIAFEVLGDFETVRKTYRAILDIFKKHEVKIDYAISKKPEHTHQYIHPRYNPVTFEEYWEEWGNKQNDSVGCILFKVGELEQNHKGLLALDDDDKRVLQKLVWYLSTLEYWHDPDSGMWEEDQEVHASSVGACLAGLKMARHIENIDVPDDLIALGEQVLHAILPRESSGKFADLALLSLIWPYELVNKEETATILENVEYHLVRERGVIRYKGDHYYNKNPDGWSEEAEWTFGLCWLAIICEKLGDHAKAASYVEKARSIATKKGMPELYFSNSTKYNDNTPLGWSESLFIVALHDVNERALSHN